MKIVLVTGMSGAGKAVAMRTLEDAGFEAIDNIPLSFLPQVAASVVSTRNLAISADVRTHDFSMTHFMDAIKPLQNQPGVDFKILFLDCDDEILRRRFTETRRRHPLAIDRPVLDGIRHERQLIDKLREVADVVIDTSETDAGELRRMVTSHFATGENSLSLVLSSFSFKRGIPREADMVFDVRFLKNPYYEPALAVFTGMDARVGAYIETDPEFSGFFLRLHEFIVPLLPRYVAEGKRYLTIAIGCTGGQHRSVYVVQKLASLLTSLGYSVAVRHRDVEA